MQCIRRGKQMTSTAKKKKNKHLLDIFMNFKFFTPRRSCKKVKNHFSTNNF